MKKLLVSLVLVILFLIVLVFVFAKDSEAPAPQSNAKPLTYASIQTDLANGAQLLDVRTPEEFKAGHVKEATNLELATIQQGSLPTTAKDKPVYVYCRSGNRAGQAQDILKKAGYQNITNLGGLEQIKSLGAPLVQ